MPVGLRAAFDSGGTSRWAPSREGTEMAPSCSVGPPDPPRTACGVGWTLFSWVVANGCPCHRPALHSPGVHSVICALLDQHSGSGGCSQARMPHQSSRALTNRDRTSSLGTRRHDIVKRVVDEHLAAPVGGSYQPVAASDLLAAHAVSELTGIVEDRIVRVSGLHRRLCAEGHLSSASSHRTSSRGRRPTRCRSSRSPWPGRRRSARSVPWCACGRRPRRTRRLGGRLSAPRGARCRPRGCPSSSG